MTDMMTVDDTTTNTAAAEKQATAKASCCQRFTTELCSTSFFPATDGTGQIIDMESSFTLACANTNINETNHYGYYIKTAVKFIFWAASTFIFAYNWVIRNEPTFYLAYLTYWSLFFSVIYFSLSLLLTAFIGNKSRTLLNTTWILFSVACVSQIYVVILYWILLVTYTPEHFHTLTWSSFGPHGAIMILIMLDGFVINRIPIRANHVVGPLLFSFGFIVWSVIENVFCRCNPDERDSEDDDANPLYPVLNWRKDVATAVLYSAVVLFVLVPIFHLLIWRVSYFGRKYKNDSHDELPTSAVSPNNEDKNVPEAVTQVNDSILGTSTSTISGVSLDEEDDGDDKV